MKAMRWVIKEPGVCEKWKEDKQAWNLEVEGVAGGEVRKAGGGKGLQSLVNSAGLQLPDECVLANLRVFSAEE